jgi:hypothetical protein
MGTIIVMTWLMDAIPLQLILGNASFITDGDGQGVGKKSDSFPYVPSGIFTLTA